MVNLNDAPVFINLYLDLKARCSWNIVVLSFADKNSNNSKQTKLESVAFAWAANPVSNLKSQWTAPEEEADGAFLKTSRIASSRDRRKDDVEFVVDLWATAFLKKENKTKLKESVQEM